MENVLTDFTIVVGSCRDKDRSQYYVAPRPFFGLSDDPKVDSDLDKDRVVKIRNALLMHPERR